MHIYYHLLCRISRGYCVAANFSICKECQPYPNYNARNKLNKIKGFSKQKNADEKADRRPYVFDNSN